MRLARELYVGDSVKELESIVYALRRNLPVAQVYGICQEEGQSPITILPVQELVRPPYVGRDFVVYGLALHKREAYGLFAQIIEEAREAGWPVARLGEYLAQTQKAAGTDAEPAAEEKAL